MYCGEGAPAVRFAFPCLAVWLSFTHDDACRLYHPFCNHSPKNWQQPSTWAGQALPITNAVPLTRCRTCRLTSVHDIVFKLRHRLRQEQYTLWPRDTSLARAECARAIQIQLCRPGVLEGRPRARYHGFQRLFSHIARTEGMCASLQALTPC